MVKSEKKERDLKMEKKGKIGLSGQKRQGEKGKQVVGWTVGGGGCCEQSPVRANDRLGACAPHTLEVAGVQQSL